MLRIRVTNLFDWKRIVNESTCGVEAGVGWVEITVLEERCGEEKQKNKHNKNYDSNRSQ
jgi:hypothetical protein